MANCKACGATIDAGSQFCNSCGRRIRNCPSCGTQLLDGVMACQDCGARVPAARTASDETRPEDGPEAEYLVWEGFPFSWLHRTSQTKTQWRVTVGLSVILVAVYVFVLAFAMTQGMSAGDQTCFSILIVGLVLLVAFGLWVKFWVGRREAEYAEREKRKDP